MVLPTRDDGEGFRGDGEIPHFVTMDGWLRQSGMSRTDTYRKIGAGHLRAVKSGRRTLIDFRHGLQWLNSLPQANITMK